MNSPDSSRRLVWAAGLLVASGAGVTTAHGLYQVAHAARVPTAIAWLYPLITDGLALVAYAATSRLVDAGRRYAAGIVVLAAGLSGLAQAVYLAGGIAQTTVAPVGLRFGVGDWPAIAAALTAHLLHLIGGTTAARSSESQALSPARRSTPAGSALSRSDMDPYNPLDVQSSSPVFHPPAVQPPRTTDEPDGAAVQPRRSMSAYNAVPAETGGSGGAGERARSAARSHVVRHGQLPTVSELMRAAEVARGTAGAVLKALRDERPALHLVNAETDQRDDQ